MRSPPSHYQSSEARPGIGSKLFIHVPQDELIFASTTILFSERGWLQYCANPTVNFWTNHRHDSHQVVDSYVGDYLLIVRQLHEDVQCAVLLMFFNSNILSPVSELAGCHERRARF